MTLSGRKLENWTQVYLISNQGAIFLLDIDLEVELLGPVEIIWETIFMLLFSHSTSLCTVSPLTHICNYYFYGFAFQII